MRRRTWLILLSVVVLGGALAGGLYWHWVSSPRYALQRMALALKTRNMPQFFKYVDLKAIFNDFVGLLPVKTWITRKIKRTKRKTIGTG